MPAATDRLVFDTSIYVDALRQGPGSPAATTLADAAGRTYLVSVVWGELRAGARDERGRQAIARLADPLSALDRVLTPERGDWLRAGDGLAAIVTGEPHLRDRARLLWNDALILLCAQHVHARVVTANEDDFHLLQRYLGGAVAPLRRS